MSSSLNRPAAPARWASALTVLSGCMVLAGWALDHEVLKRLLPHLPPMNPATAACFVLGGVSLGFLVAGPGGRPARLAGRACAAAVLLVGAAMLAAVVAGWDLGVDQLLFRSKVDGTGSRLTSRMAPNSALNFVLLGSALLLEWTGTRRRRGVDVLLLTAAAVALASLLAHAYGIGTVYGIGFYIPMALNASLTFLALSTGVMFVRPSTGLVALMTSDTSGGLMVRRILGPTVFCVAGLGWLRLEGERAGLYSGPVGVALFAAAIIVVLVVLVLGNAHLLHRADRRRQESEAARQEILERYRLVQCATNDTTWDLDLATEQLHWGEGIHATFGYAEDAVRGDLRWWTERIHPDDVERVYAGLSRAINGGAKHWAGEYRFRHADGEYRTVLDRGFVVRRGDATPVRMIGSLMDVTELRRGQEAVARLAAIVESSDDAVVSHGLDGTVLTWNGAAERIYGYRAEEVLGRPLSLLAPPEPPDEVPGMLELIRAGGRVSHHETTHVRRDGTRIEVALTISPISDGRGGVTGASVIARDVTERKRAEEEARRKRWLAGIGATALAVRHEINNPLAAMLADAAVLEMGGNTPDEAAEMVRSITRQARRVAGVLRRLDNIPHDPPLVRMAGSEMLDLSGAVETRAL